MINSGSQSNSAQYSADEFKALLREILPLWEKLLPLAKDFCDEKATSSAPSPCNGCPKREKCTELCELVKPQLPKEYGGKLHGEGTINLNLDNIRRTDDFCDDLEKDDPGKVDRGKLKNFKNVEPIDLFSEYEAYLSIFSKKQQQVLASYHCDGKTITEIAKELHKYPSTIWGLLQRAETRLKKAKQKGKEKNF